MNVAYSGSGERNTVVANFEILFASLSDCLHEFSRECDAANASNTQLHCATHSTSAEEDELA